MSLARKYRIVPTSSPWVSEDAPAPVNDCGSPTTQNKANKNDNHRAVAEWEDSDSALFFTLIGGFQTQQTT